MSKNFAITGVAGYIAPRHLKAIKDTGNILVAAVDPNDSVGIIDSFFDNVRFFTEFERFDRHVDKLRRQGHGQQIDYVSICSPNYLHDAHARFALRVGADVICEKPVVLNPWNIDALQELEKESGKRIYTVLQLRLLPSLMTLKEKLQSQISNTKKDIQLTYITSRGPWYLVSWKGQVERSGGLTTNIGIHFFDLLIWLFGEVQYSEVHISYPTKTGGFLELKNARVRWLLSIDKADLPEETRNKNKTTFRSITIDGEELEFSEGFTDLHTTVYKEVLAGRGFTLDDARPSVTLAHQIRNAIPTGLNANSHPWLRKLK
jgi:UDP-N-acetyl-2-amino-2-deoxyglucuronate dehydrogenase